MGSTKQQSRPRRRPGRPPTTRRWLLLAAAGVVVLVAVAVAVVHSAGSDTSAAGASGERVVVEHQGGSRVGEQATSFRATTTTGGQFTLPAGKPAVVFFMAVWCNPQLEASGLDRIERDRGGQVAVLGVDADPSEPAATLRGFADRIGARYGYVRDSDGALSRAFGVQAMDTTIVVDAAGRIVFRDAVPTDEATLRAAIRKAAQP
jgi:peroxiredoxin